MRCQDLGIATIIIPGIHIRQWVKVAQLCEENSSHSRLFYAAGLHPWWIEEQGVVKTIDAKDGDQISRDFAAKLSGEIEKHANHASCVAVGECGLDGTIKTSMEFQSDVFETHLQVAQDLQLPLIVHSVKAHDSVIKVIKKYSGVRGVIHAFSGSYEQAMQFVKLGFCLSVGGVITYERAKKTRDAFARVPLDSLLLETDAPDMPVSGRQGERNSPEFLPEILQHLSSVRQNESLEQLRNATTENAHKLFTKIQS